MDYVVFDSVDNAVKRPMACIVENAERLLIGAAIRSIDIYLD